MGSASCINESDYGISHLTIQDIFKKNTPGLCKYDYNSIEFVRK
mgnify:CR=1 FL=1